MRFPLIDKLNSPISGANAKNLGELVGLEPVNVRARCDFRASERVGVVDGSRFAI